MRDTFEGVVRKDYLKRTIVIEDKAADERVDLNDILGTHFEGMRVRIILDVDDTTRHN